MQEDHISHSKHWLYWSPGNSPRVNAIVDHMTPEERRLLMIYSILGGGGLGLSIAGISLVLHFLIMGIQVGLPVAIIVLVAYALAIYFLLYHLQKMSGDFLKNTAWSKAQGWDKEPLPLKTWHT